MKTKQIFLFVLICLTFGFCRPNQAQNSNAQPSRFIEQPFGNQVYVYDTLRHVIQNKKNYIYEINENLPYDCKCGIEMIEPYYYKIVDEMFSAERKKELKELTVLFIFYADSLGNVLEVSFMAKKILLLTLQEVSALEKAFLQYKVRIIDPCPGKKYYLFTGTYWFSGKERT